MENSSISAPAGALKPGFILGLLFILILFIGYTVDATLLIDTKFSGLIVLGLIIGAVVMAIQFRNSNGGHLSYGGSYSFHFISLALGALLGVLFTILLFEVIDPGLQSFLGDIILEQVVDVLEKRGESMSTINGRYDVLRDYAYNQVSAMSFMKTYIFLLVLFAIVSALVALIAKKEKPGAEVY